MRPTYVIRDVTSQYVRDVAMVGAQVAWPRRGEAGIELRISLSWREKVGVTGWVTELGGQGNGNQLPRCQASISYM